MNTKIPAKYRDLVSWDKKAFAHLALVLRDATPHVTPVWFDYDGEHVIVNRGFNIPVRNLFNIVE